MQCQDRPLFQARFTHQTTSCTLHLDVPQTTQAHHQMELFNPCAATASLPVHTAKEMAPPSTWPPEPETRKSSQTLPSASPYPSPVSTLCSLSGSQPPFPQSCIRGGASPCSLPSFFPFHPFPHCCQSVSFYMQINTGTFQVTLLLKILNGTHSFGGFLFVFIEICLTYNIV